MFARHVSIKLKEDSIEKFARVVRTEVIPLLREQEGFLDQIILLSPDRPEAVVITFWDKRESEEAFNRLGSPDVLKDLLAVIEGVPDVRLFEVLNQTFPDLAAREGAGSSR